MKHANRLRPDILAVRASRPQGLHIGSERNLLSRITLPVVPPLIFNSSERCYLRRIVLSGKPLQPWTNILVIWLAIDFNG